MPKKFKFRPKRNVDGSMSPHNNGQRDANVRQVLLAARPQYRDITHRTDPTDLQDFLSDLGHYCDRKGYDFDDVVRMARANWQAER